MEINAFWHKPIRLADGSKHNLLYYFPIDKVPESSGCYLFYNLHGKSYSVLYIGRADNLKKRLEQQMNNLKLMMGIRQNLNGKKHLIFCSAKLKQGQKIEKVLQVIESNLIKTALASGAELLNKQGTKKRYNSIVFKGNRQSERLVGRRISVEK
jgi:hypothetical protein